MKFSANLGQDVVLLLGGQEQLFVITKDLLIIGRELGSFSRFMGILRSVFTISLSISIWNLHIAFLFRELTCSPLCHLIVSMKRCRFAIYHLLRALVVLSFILVLKWWAEIPMILSAVILAADVHFPGCTPVPWMMIVLQVFVLHHMDSILGLRSCIWVDYG